ncbi:MAG: metallophosphoesterase [Planctomycetota bacterium]
MVERFDLPHPDLPPGLDGLSVLHLTDTHVRSHPAPVRSQTQRRLPRVLARIQDQAPPDLAVFTGDAMDRPEDEDAALAALEQQLSALRPRLGWFGVFGNHDTPGFQRRAKELTAIRWLCNTHEDLDRAPLRILGVSEPEDVFEAVLGLPRVEPGASQPFTLCLAHFPPQVYPIARFGLPLLLAGHTHGGQIRPSPKSVPHTSSDLTTDLGTGLLRLGRTLCAISRGVGETAIDLRINCPPQLPLYTLRRGPLPGGPDQDDPPRLRQVIPW